MRILVVDDHPLIREGLAHLLRQLDPAVEVVEAISAERARAAFDRDAAFSLVLLDLSLPGAHGMSLLEELRLARPEVPVVVLSGSDSRANVLAAIDRGAMGFISKRSSTSVMVSALRLVLAGGVYIPPEALDPEAKSVDDPAPADAAPLASAVASLTQRQTEILALLVEGKPNKLICRELGIAEGTVKAHISAILRALGVENRTEAVLKLGARGTRLR
jgi:DNA-binding NarL/FixJ family response regulator